MKKASIGLVLLISAFLFTPGQLKAQNKAKDIDQSYIGAFGEKPTAAEMDYWMKQPDMPVLKRLDAHRAYMKANPSAGEKAINKSYMYDFGRLPSRAEIDYWLPQNQLFLELTQKHLAYLQSNNKEWMETVARAYIFITNGKRPAAADLNTWGAVPRVDFMELGEQMKRGGVR